MKFRRVKQIPSFTSLIIPPYLLYIYHSVHLFPFDCVYPPYGILLARPTVVLARFASCEGPAKLHGRHTGGGGV